MVKFTCPSCGSEVVFQTSIAVCAVCAYCRSLLVRDSQSLRDLGKVAILPPDMSPFQLGTTGKIGDISFTLIGRAKYRWEDGTWNEWYCQFDDQRTGWLAEAQGDLMLTFAIADTEKALVKLTPNDIRFFKPGHVAKIDDVKYQVVDIKDCYCLSVEGEIPFQADTERVIRSVDLVGPDRAFATLSVTGNVKDFYVGGYVTFLGLGLTNLRAVPGWDLATALPAQGRAP